MELLWIKYSKTNKYYLVLLLVTTEEHIMGIVNDHIDSTEFRVLKSSLESLKNSDTVSRLNLVKLLCPKSYRDGFRKFSRDKTKVVKTMPLDAVK